MANTAYVLERKLNKKAVKDFVDKGGLKAKPQNDKGVVPALQWTSKVLERKMNVDAISRKLVSRPNVGWLKNMGVMNVTGVAGRIQAAAKKLERKVSVPRLTRNLDIDGGRGGARIFRFL